MGTIDTRFNGHDGLENERVLTKRLGLIVVTYLLKKFESQYRSRHIYRHLQTSVDSIHSIGK